MDRRRFLHRAWAAPLLAGCAARPDGATPAPARDEALLGLGRGLIGGFVGPVAPGTGLPARPGTGMFVKWLAPGAIALRGTELLVLDAGAGRLWRCDTALDTLAGIAGAPTTPGVMLALGPDLSAWVLDPLARQVLRFARDGRLLQRWRIGLALPTPVALALAEGGATLLLADGMGAQWAEQRGPAGPVQTIGPAMDDGRRITGVDALALPAQRADDSVWVLDRLGGAVHRVQRSGVVRQTLGRGELIAPSALAVDRFDRAWVLDSGGQSLICLQAGFPTQRLQATALGLQQIGGLAVDERTLALSDPLTGQVQLHRIGRPATP